MATQIGELVIPYGNFQLQAIIDPDEANANNRAMVNKTNEMRVLLNGILNSSSEDPLIAAHDGDPLAHGATSAPTPEKIIKRDSFGRAQVEVPLTDKDIVNQIFMLGSSNSDLRNVKSLAVSVDTRKMHIERDGAGRVSMIEILDDQLSLLTAELVRDLSGRISSIDITSDEVVVTYSFIRNVLGKITDINKEVTYV